MNIPQEDLDRWEETAVFVNGRLLKAQDALRRGEVNAAGKCIEEAGERNWGTRKALLRTGAKDSIREEARSLRGESSMAPDPDLPLLTSPTNRRYCELLRELHAVAIERDKERGWFPDGSSEAIGDMLADAELEVFGPVGLRGMEQGD